MRIASTITMILITLATSGARAQETQALFNGKDLTGWILVNTPPQTWSVSDGMLICTGKPIGEIRTERMYQNFELELEWRHMVPKGNAGVFVWADDITAPGVPFHRGIEVQVLENAYGNSDSHTTHGDIFPIHGATMTPENGRRGSRAFPTEERSKPSPEWNHYRIVCQDGTVSLAVNGKVVTRGKDASPRKGYICLESEGGVVHYRNLKLKELPDAPVENKDIAIAYRGYRSIYSGLDLSGWTLATKSESAWQADDWVLKFDGSLSSRDARIEHQLTQPCKGSVVDFRWSDKSKSLTLQLPSASPIVITTAKDSKLSSALKPLGQWNRIEVKLDAKTFELNGNKFEIQTPADNSNKLVITPEGPIELANIYIR